MRAFRVSRVAAVPPLPSAAARPLPSFPPPSARECSVCAPWPLVCPASATARRGPPPRNPAPRHGALQLCLAAALLASSTASPARLRLRSAAARHGCHPPLHAEPPLEPPPPSINPRIRLLSSQRSSRAQPSPPRLAGTPPQRHSTAAGRHSPWSRRHWPPRALKPPPTGSSRSPLPPPPLPRCQQALPWPESPFPLLPCFKIATRDLVRQLKQVQGPICTTVDSYE